MAPLNTTDQLNRCRDDCTDARLIIAELICRINDVRYETSRHDDTTKRAFEKALIELYIYTNTASTELESLSNSSRAYHVRPASD